MFLMEYNRPTGKLVTFRRFDDASLARREQFALEMDLHHKGIAHEVVLLEAENEAAIRKTHRRYFEDLEQLLHSIAEMPKEHVS